MGPFGTMPQEPWHLGKGAKRDRVIQLYCGEVHTHATFKRTRTWENFNNLGKKMILLSDELWLRANNSNIFANGIKSVTRNNLRFCKYSDIYLIDNFKSRFERYRFGMEGYIKQINDIWEYQKKRRNSADLAEKGHAWYWEVLLKTFFMSMNMTQHYL